ncbi:hypothetical protein IAU59_006791 [Kwoniella sp. CBS 9459]
MPGSTSSSSAVRDAKAADSAPHGAANVNVQINSVASQNSALLEAHHEECNAKHELENGAGPSASSSSADNDNHNTSANRDDRTSKMGEVMPSPPVSGNPNQFLEGTYDFAIPAAAVQGTAPPLSARAYQLSKGYSHLVEAPDQYRAVICEKLGKLEADLPQLGSDDLRQARADIVYLRTILEGEDNNVAQVHAGATWAAKET